MDSNEPECAQSNLWRLIPSAKPSSKSTGLRCPVTETSQLSMLPPDSPMFSAVASPVRISALPERALELQARGADSGANTRDLLAKYDHATQSWRTSQRCLVEGWAKYSETWPRSDMMQNGIAYQRQQLERCTTGTEFGFKLIPTPTACDYKGSGRLRLERGENNNLRDWFKIKFGFLYPPVAAVEYLMGYPAGWASLKATETRSSRKSRKSSAAPSCGT